MDTKGSKALIVVLCMWLAACVKDKPATSIGIAPAGKGNVYVVCEGNFGNGDGTLYAYRPDKDSVFGDLYRAANAQPLGDVFQSMTRIDSRFFLCINNSDKVVVLDPDTRKVVGVIAIPKPRYVLPVSSTKAYVSALYGNTVYIINTQTLQVTGTIALPANNPEGMCLAGGNLIVCPWDTTVNEVYKIDITTDRIIQTIATGGYAPQAALVDADQMVWVLSGNQTKGKTAAWTRIDPSSGNILSTYHFAPEADVLKPVLNTTKDTIYYIEVNYKGGTAHNGIYRMGIHAPALPAVAFLQARQYQYFWGLGIDPATGDVYAGDPKGFIQKGSVYIYNRAGEELGNFTTGLGPGNFLFD